MALFSLNRDVLLYICSLLSRHDAFNFSLTCKTSREISLKYTCSEATCSTSDQIRALTTFMLAPEPGHDRPRATYLESLSISEDSYSDQESDEDSSTSDILESVHLIADLLSNTPNLRRLSFENFHESVNSSESLVGSLTSLRRLTFLHVDPVADASLAIVRSIPSDLKHLSLDYLDKELFELPDENFTLVSFFHTISAFLNLTHIELNNFTLPTPTSPISHTFPSIHHVKVSGQPWFVDLCPNVCTVSVALSSISHQIKVLPASPRWPPLRRLTVFSDEELAILRRRLPSVDALEISVQKAMTQRTLLGGPSDAEESSFVDCLRQVNPISLHRTFLFASSILPAVLAGTPVLRNMVSAAPRLRSLKISLEWVRIPEGENFREGLVVSSGSSCSL